jgi:hypothetical protein
MNWRAMAAGALIATGFSNAIGLNFWASTMLAGIFLALDSFKVKHKVE